MKAPPRPSMSKVRRLRIWERDGGVCYWCETEVADDEPWDVEHKRPWAESFDDSDENLGVIHRLICHREKTDEDLARLAKAKAQGGETGQYARRQRREKPLIQSRGFEKPKQKRAWPKGRKIR